MQEYLFISSIPVIGYLILIAILFRPIPSISESCYEWEKRMKHLEWLFYGWTILAVASICPMMFVLAEGDWYQFFALFAAGGLMLAGASPRFKEHQKTAHYAGAVVSAVFTFAWIVLKGYWLTAVIVLLIAGVLTKLQPQSRTFWFENAMIAGIYMVLYLIIQK